VGALYCSPVDPFTFIRGVYPQFVCARGVVTNTICLGPGDETLLGPHVTIVPEKNVTPCQGDLSVGATLMGWVASWSYVARKCRCNAHRAMCMRHGVIQPEVSSAVDFGALTRRLCEVLQECRSDYDQSIWHRPEVWMGKWPLVKQTQVARSILVDDVWPGSVDAMVKRECYSAIPKRARLIQMYSNKATQALFGPQFYAFQVVVLKFLNDYEMFPGVFVTVSCGLNPIDVAMWLQHCLDHGATTFYESDGKNWDGTMSMPHMDLRLSALAALDPELSRFARRGVSVKGVGYFREGKFRYKIATTVKSGHNDTTSGNSLVRLMIAADVFRRLGVRCWIIVSGDDMFVCVAGDFSYQRAVEYEREYGIVPESRKFTNPFSGSFVSSIWVTDGSVIGFVPKPGRLLARLFWTVHPPSPRMRAIYLRSIVRGLVGVCGDLPVIRVLLQRFDSEGEVRVSDKSRWYSTTTIRFGPGIWDHFADRYSLTVAELVDCERWLGTLPVEPGFLQHPVIQRMVDVDMADLLDRE